MPRLKNGYTGTAGLQVPGTTNAFPLAASERKTRITISLTEIELAKLCGMAVGLRMSMQEAIKFKLFGRAA